MALLLTAATAIACVSHLQAEDSKSQYTVLNPTPDAKLRPLDLVNLDRVGSPFTVDAGHFQVSADFIDASLNPARHNRYADGEVVDYSQASYLWSPSFSVGLLNNLDLEVLPSYYVDYFHDTLHFPNQPSLSFNSSSSGFRNTIIASALNFWGNDTGVTSFGIIPQLSIPSSGSGDIMGGAAIPFAVRLPYKILLKLESSIWTVQDIDGSLYARFGNSIAIEKEIIDRLTVACSFCSNFASRSDADWWGSANLGLGYSITPNFFVYAGTGFGVENAYDYNPYAGVIWRF